MMKKVFLILLIGTGCSPVYVPNARNSPLFTKAGEFQGTVALGNGIDVQTAASITNHIGVMANYSYEDRNGSQYTTNFNDDDYHHHKFFEGGIGYYENVKNWCYEVFAGYGKGEGSSYDSYVWWNNVDQKATGKYERFFIQPAFGLNKKIMSVSFVPRVSLVDFKEFSNDVSTYKINASPKVFFEPAVIGKVNLVDNHLILMFQAGVSFVPDGSKLFYDYRPFQFSTGIGFRIGGIKSDRPNDTNGQ
ncbi:MAG: hypothetical protein ABI477_08810 [Chryseolinea sp.]